MRSRKQSRYLAPFRIEVRSRSGRLLRVARRGLPLQGPALIQARQLAEALGKWVLVVDGAGNLVAEYGA